MGWHFNKAFTPWMLLGAIIFAQSNVLGESFTEYLTGRQILAIVVDSKRGLIWFGADGGGLSRFDGTRLTDYTAENSPLRDNRILSLALDHDGYLWVGTFSKGAARFNPDSSTWQFYDTSNGLVDNKVRSLAVDGRGRVWFGTDAGVGLYDRMNWYRYTKQDYARWDSVNLRWVIIKVYGRNEKRLSDNKVNAIAADAAGTMWFGTGNGLSRLKGENEWENFLTASEIWSIFVDQHRTKWLGTNGGEGPSFYMSVEVGSSFSLKSISIPCFSLRQLPPIPDIYDIMADQEGNLWLGTTFGPFRFNPVSMTWRCYTSSADINRSNIQAIAADQDGNVWFGSISPPGAIKFKANWFDFSRFLGDDINNDEIFDMARDQLRQIWIGTGDGLAYYNSGAWRSKRYWPANPRYGVTAIKVAPDSTLWLGTGGLGVFQIRADATLIENFTVMNTQGGLLNDRSSAIAVDRNFIWIGASIGLNRFDRATRTWRKFTMENTRGGLLGNQIEALAVDLQGRLGVGTTRGLSRFDNARHTDPRPDSAWVNFTTVNTPQGLGVNTINSITVDQFSGRVWIGTEGGGASNFLDGRWERFTMDDGLADNFVKDVLVLNDRNEIWFGAGGGVSCLNRGTKQWTTYTVLDGLVDNHVTTLIEGVDEDEIWFGTRADGVTRYRRQKSFPDTEILQPFDVTTQSEVVFRFLGNDLNTSIEMMRYSYKLDDEAWSEYIVDNFARRFVATTGLHTFYVKAVDKDGNEDPSPATKSFSIVDPDTGSHSIFTDKTQTHGFDTVKIKIYWPPYQLPKRTPFQFTIKPVPPDSLKKKPTLLSYDIQPFGTDIRRKGVILTFEFPQTAATLNQQYSIHRDIDAQGRPDNTNLGGTQTVAGGLVRITTAINQFGRYAVRAVNVPSQSVTFRADSINAQPRVFSPSGGGHGPQTTLSFLLQQPAHVKIRIYNLAGRLINTICDETLNAGVNAIAWNGRDYNGQICPTGLYIIAIESNVLKGYKQVMVLNE